MSSGSVTKRKTDSNLKAKTLNHLRLSNKSLNNYDKNRNKTEQSNIRDNKLLNKKSIKNNNKKAKREKLKLLFIEKYTHKFQALEFIDIIEKHVLELIKLEKNLE